MCRQRGANLASDRYELIESLGTGGMARVWKARDTVLGRLVAVKRLLPHSAAEPRFPERFRREAQAAASLSHPGIVTVYDTGEDEDGPFIVMELVEGETLRTRLSRTGPFDLASASSIVEQVAAALDYAHEQGVIHRDVKPSNLILQTDGKVKLADFGIARSANDTATITEPGSLVGTLAYLAPEVIEGGSATPRSDIYSLGAVTYEMLTGRAPFEAESLGALVSAIRAGESAPLSGVPASAARAVMTAMSADPDLRPSKASEFAGALRRNGTLVIPSAPAGSGEGRPPSVGASDPTAILNPQQLRGPFRRRNWLLAVPLLLGALGLAIFATVSNGSGPAAAITSSSTTSIQSTTTTTAATTTTQASTTTTLPPIEAAAAELEAHIAELSPPTYLPPDIKEISETLDAVMVAWAADDQKTLKKELERLGNQIQGLADTEEAGHLMDHFIELADLMGFDVKRGGGDDD